MDDNLEVEELGHQKRHGQASESQWEINTWYSNASEQACRKAHQLNLHSPDATREAFVTIIRKWGGMRQINSITLVFSILVGSFYCSWLRFMQVILPIICYLELADYHNLHFNVVTSVANVPFYVSDHRLEITLQLQTVQSTGDWWPMAGASLSSLSTHYLVANGCAQPLNVRIHTLTH